MSARLDISNTGDQIIRVAISAANFDKYVPASGIESASLQLGTTYNITLTKGRTVKHTNFTPSQDLATLEVDRYFA